MSISIIVAIADNNAIGRNNGLLCHIPEDLKRVKRITTGHRIIMGRNTFLSLPEKNRPLKDRTNIVISDVPGESFDGCVMAGSVEEVLEMCPREEECFVFGGGMIYRQMLRHADKLYITRIFKSFKADAFFPEINYDEWDEIEREDQPYDEKNKFNYSFITYRKKN